MTRPALIVGLGGTGQWVLTWLKRDLMLSNGGTVPDNIRLLSIDTATTLEAGQKQVTANDKEDNQPAKVGGVTLDRTEFIYVGGDARPIALETRDNRHPQLKRWFRAKYWLDTQPPAVFVLDNGAGRIRQFGRLAIYKDIMGGDDGQKLWSAFRTAIGTVGRMTNAERRLEIIVVGSFAGGTGSGMFLDVGLILRKLAKEISPHHVLRGFFALPGVFTPNPSRDMKARTFAAWRELNRFMVIDSDFPMSSVDYVENDSTYGIDPAERIFDACYLVEGKRKGAPVASEARFGVFPMVSEVISAILDEQAGQVYNDWVYTNLAEEYGKHPTTPMYSAIGAYTVQVPANFVEVMSSHIFGQEMLKRLLSPEVAPDANTKKLVASGALRHLTLAAKARNLEDPGFAGRQRADTFLTSESAYEGQMVNPTIFMARAATLLSEAREQGKLPQVIDRLARAGTMGGGGAEGWARFYPEFGNDPEFESLLRDVRDHTHFNIVTAFSRREKEKAEDFRKRIIQLDPLVQTKFGSSKIGGDQMIEYDGSFGVVLDRVHETQMIVFRQALRLRLLSLLMGRDANPLKARGGKLGYTWDFFDGVAANLDWFLNQVMDGVSKRRKELRPSIDAEIRNRKAEDYMDKVRDKRFLFLWESPSVKKSETLFLRTEQEKMDIRREDILYRYVDRTLRAMKAAAEQTRDAVQAWIWHLSTGDDASELPGIWDELLSSEANVKEAHGWDQSTDTVQRMVAEEVLPVSEEDLANILRRWQWDAGYEHEHLWLKVNILPEAEGEPIDVLNNPVRESLARRDEVGAHNTSRLLGLARRNYAGLVGRTTVAETIIDEYGPNGGVRFANDVATKNAEPLFVGSTTNKPKRQSNLIRVKSPANDQFFTGKDSAQSQLRVLAQKDPVNADANYLIQVVGSENPFKLTLVRSDDLYNFDEFAAWEDCQSAYAAHVNDKEGLMRPVNLHNFAAEANAVEFETRLVKDKKKSYRPLHPRVVMLLENPEPLRQFLYLLILGNITEAHDRSAYHWELSWDRADGTETIYLTKPWNEDEERAHSAKPDIFNAAHGYVIRQKSHEKYSQAEVDIEFGRIYIDRAMADAGRQAVHDVLNNELNGKGEIGKMERAARERDKNTIIRQDLEDLAIVFRMMLQDDLSHHQPVIEERRENAFERARRLREETEAAAAAEATKAAKARSKTNKTGGSTKTT